MDPKQPIHPRTIMDHQNFQLRDSARINARAFARSLEPNALQAGVVMEVSPAGFVMLDDFSSESGEGEWMAVLGRNFPHVGDIAVYAMVKGAPVVLGTIANEYDPSRISSPNFIYECEHFHNLNQTTTGNIGDHGLSHTGSGYTFTNWTGPGLGTPPQGNGWVYVTTGSVIGNYGIIYNGLSNISMFTLNTFEIGFMIGSLTSEYLNVAITDSIVAAPTNSIQLTYDTNVGSKFTIQGFNAGVSVFGVITTDFTPVANTLMCVRFTKLQDGVWEIHYRIPENSEEAISLGVYEGLPGDTSVNFGAAIYNRAASARTLYVDYMAWSIEGMAGVF